MKATRMWPSSFHRLVLLWFCPWNPKCFFQWNKHSKCTKLKLRIHNFIDNIDCNATRHPSHRRDPGCGVESEKSGLPSRASWPATVKRKRHRVTMASSQWDNRRKVTGKCLSSNARQTFSKGVEVSSETRSFLRQPHGSPFVTTHMTLLCHRSFRLCRIHYSESTRTRVTRVLSCLVAHSRLLQFESTPVGLFNSSVGKNCYPHAAKDPNSPFLSKNLLSDSQTPGRIETNWLIMIGLIKSIRYFQK